MRFLVDECAGPALARWLQGEGHEVLSVYDQARGLDDESVLRQAFAEERILITNDRDFGELVYREKRPHKGVVLLRLDDERAASKIATMKRLLDDYGDRLVGSFAVVSESQVRFARR